MLTERFDVESSTHPDHARVVASAGTHFAIVLSAGFVQLEVDVPVIEVADRIGPEVLEQVLAVHERTPDAQRARASKLAHLASITYDEYSGRVRARATRDYLLALLANHHGVVTAAARSAGMLRETLHRLIRRHDIDPAWFRQPHED